MTRQERSKLLADALTAANRRAQEELVDKAKVERISEAVKAKLAHRIHAEGDDDLVCPSCGYKGTEADFEPDTDEESDGFSTDPETSETGDADGVEELDAAGKKRVVAELLRNHKRRS